MTGHIMIKPRRILTYLFVFIFLPPQCFESMDNLVLVTQFLAVARYVISAIGIIYYLLYWRSEKKRKNGVNGLVLLTFIIAVVKIIAMYNNGSLYLTAALSFLSIPGFVMCNVLMYRKNPARLFKTYRNIIFAYLLIHFVMLFVFPNGIVPGLSGDSRIWFMGGKNTVSTYMLLGVFSVYLYDYVTNHIRNRKRIYMFVLLNIILIVNSSSTGFLSLLIVEVFLGLAWIIKYSKLPAVFQRLLVAASVLIILLFFWFNVLSGSGTSIFSLISSAILGKGYTFSGRQAIWAAAIGYIVSNPLWGTGYEVVYNVWGNNQYVYSAHNAFLDLAVKYGCIVLVLFCILLLFVLKRIWSSFFGTRQEISFVGLAFFVALMAISMFEATEGFYTVWGILLFLCFIAEKGKGNIWRGSYVQ